VDYAQSVTCFNQIFKEMNDHFLSDGQTAAPLEKLVRQVRKVRQSLVQQELFKNGMS